MFKRKLTTLVRRSLRNSMKLSKTMAKKQNKLLSLWCWTSGEIPWRWWQMVTIGDENGDDFVSMSTYWKKRMPIQIQAEPTTQLLLRTVTEESKLTNRSSWVSPDCHLPTRPDRQTIWWDCQINISISNHVPRGWGEGVATEGGGGGFSGLNDKLYTGHQSTKLLCISVLCDTDGQPFHIPVTVSKIKFRTVCD